ncbi:MAG: LLM class flavin-dependent oxidoreductase [Myxococcales bacterium]|nr:LLM class flavin-dependent oxidoreductase [Myxococcales bacterium]
MKFGVFYEHQLPKPWDEGQEHRLFHEALEQVVLADELGIDFAWEVEHHFLEEYSHSSAPEVFLAAAAARTKRIRLGHGIRQVIPHYNHPARVAEGLATLDLLSDGRVEFGIGEGATRHEIHGFNIPAKRKRALSLEAAEQIANMMVMTPYPGFEGEGFSMPCRNVIPKPLQKPHPPMWIACTNRETIKLAAERGLGALAFSFVDPDEARTWAETYYGIIKSDRCVPLGHSVNANIAMVSGFSVHDDAEEAVARGQEGFEFFGYALQSLVIRPSIPGRTTLFEDFVKSRGELTSRALRGAAGIGTPDQVRSDLRGFEEVGVDQVIFLQQAGNNRHQHICESLERFARQVMPDFAEKEAEREARKREELAPYIEAALARKKKMEPLADDAIPVIEPIVKIG